MNYITPQQAATELLRRRKARKSLVDFARYVEVPGAPVNEEDEDSEEFLPVETELAAHHLLILEAAQRCIEKHMGRLMIFMPPGAAKSTYGSQVVPAFAMALKKNYRIISVSHNSNLAKKMGRRTRSIVKQKAYESLFNCGLSSESSAADEWALTNGSEYMSGGMLSGIAGNRADLVVIDDPIRGRQDADSEVVRSNVMDAYQDDILTRLKPGGSVIIIQTRWHEADLAGSLLPRDYDGRSGVVTGQDGQEWEVLCLPAQAEREDDPLGRKPGEYLWPEWFDEAHWQQFRRNARTWSALYQQRPAPDSGDYFKKEWIHEVDHIPPVSTLRIYGGSDYAVTQDGGDYTVHAVVGVDPNNRLYLLDVWRAQTSSDKWVEAFCDLVRKWKPIGWAEETGQIKSGVGPFLVKRMLETASYVAREQFPTRGDKAVRAQSFRGRIAMSGLHIPRDAPWKSDVISEMMSFPVGVHDDIADSLGLVGQLLDRMLAGVPLPPKPEEPNPEEEMMITPPPLIERRRR
jgi:predicted phage terminase large subunit-like protein